LADTIFDLSNSKWLAIDESKSLKAKKTKTSSSKELELFHMASNR